MNHWMKGLLAAGLLAIGAGCYPMGGIYNGTTTPHVATRVNSDGPGKTGDKMGEACATGILGLAAWGDASVDAAKKDGKITEVHSMEFRDFNILFIYHQGCTQVHGK